MVRNLVHSQSVFYGETRSVALERASGLYVHMTRIQGDLERELRGYDDAVFERTVFPERVLFPLRWMLQNAIRFQAQGPVERAMVRERMLRVMFSGPTAAAIERDLLTEEFSRAFVAAPFHDKQSMAERLAEQIIGAYYPEIMDFYVATLRSFFAAQRVAPEHVEWLLAGVPQSRNALAEQPPAVNPAAVWDGREFDIDVARGQVVRMRSPGRRVAADTGTDARNDKEARIVGNLARVNSWNSWDPLRRIIVGRADGTMVQAPEPAVFRDWPDDGFPRGTFGPLPEQMVAAANEQLDGFARILENRGIVVDRPVPLDFSQPVCTPEWKQDSMFGCMPPRDVIITVGNEILESTMSYRSRWFEYLCYRPLIESYFSADPNMRWEAAPKPRLTDASYKAGFSGEFEALSHEAQVARVRANDLCLTEAEPLFDAAPRWSRPDRRRSVCPASGAWRSTLLT